MQQLKMMIQTMFYRYYFKTITNYYNIIIFFVIKNMFHVKQLDNSLLDISIMKCG